MIGAQNNVTVSRGIHANFKDIKQRIYIWVNPDEEDVHKEDHVPGREEEWILNVDSLARTSYPQLIARTLS